MTIGALYIYKKKNNKKVKSSSCKSLDKLIPLKDQILVDCLTLISLALQNPCKALYEFYNMLCILQMGMLKSTEKLNATLLFYANNWPMCWLNCVVIHSWQVFSMLHQGVTAGHFEQIDIYFGTHPPLLIFSLSLLIFQAVCKGNLFKLCSSVSFCLFICLLNG